MAGGVIGSRSGRRRTALVGGAALDGLDRLRTGRDWAWRRHGDVRASLCGRSRDEVYLKSLCWRVLASVAATANGRRGRRRGGGGEAGDGALSLLESAARRGETGGRWSRRVGGGAGASVATARANGRAKVQARRRQRGAAVSVASQQRACLGSRGAGKAEVEEEQRVVCVGGTLNRRFENTKREARGSLRKEGGRG